MADYSPYDLLNVDQAAQALRLSRRQVQRLCLQGKLGVRQGGRYLIQRQDVERFAAIPRRRGRPRKQEVQHGQGERQVE